MDQNGIKWLNRVIGDIGVDFINKVENLNLSLENLTKTIKDFSKSTETLSMQANKLIWWYVILTGIIAIATVINIFCG